MAHAYSNSKNNKVNANDVNGCGESEVKPTTFHDFLGKKGHVQESFPEAVGGERPLQEVSPSTTYDLGFERHVSDHLEGIPFYGSRGPESSHRFTGNKRSNSDDTFMASSRDIFRIGPGDSQDSPLLTKLLRYSGGERPRRPSDEEASLSMHQTRPISGSLTNQWDKVLHTNLGPAFDYPPRAGQAMHPYSYQAPLNRFKEMNMGPSVISQTAADEGSRTGIKGSRIFSTMNNATAGGAKQPSGVLIRSGKQKPDICISEPDSSTNPSEGGTETRGRQMTIFYGGQAHVFDNVHPNKVDVIMALAGSNGGSWSTTYMPNRAAKSENLIPCNDVILRKLHERPSNKGNYQGGIRTKEKPDSVN